MGFSDSLNGCSRGCDARAGRWSSSGLFMDRFLCRRKYRRHESRGDHSAISTVGAPPPRRRTSARGSSRTGPLPVLAAKSATIGKSVISFSVLETDLSYIGSSSTFVPPNNLIAGGCGTTCGASATNELSWLSTFRGRTGIAFDRIMVFGTAGVAVGQVNNHWGWGNTGFSDKQFSSSSTKAGYVVGGGIELILAPKWTVRAEAMHIDLGTSRSTITGTALIRRRAGHIHHRIQEHRQYWTPGPGLPVVKAEPSLLLLRLNIGSLDYRPPFSGFAVKENIQSGRALLLARWNFVSCIGQALYHDRIRGVGDPTDARARSLRVCFERYDPCRYCGMAATLTIWTGTNKAGSARAQCARKLLTRRNPHRPVTTAQTSSTPAAFVRQNAPAWTTPGYDNRTDLDGFWIDLVAADIDNRLFPSGDNEQALRRDHPDVARIEPSVFEDALGVTRLHQRSLRRKCGRENGCVPALLGSPVGQKSSTTSAPIQGAI